MSKKIVYEWRENVMYIENNPVATCKRFKGQIYAELYGTNYFTIVDTADDVAKFIQARNKIKK